MIVLSKGNEAAELLQEVREYLSDPPVSDQKLTGFILRGMRHINDVAAADQDFAEDDLPKTLLLDYCRYALSQALEVFDKNFESELIELNERTRLKEYEDQNSN